MTDDFVPPAALSNDDSQVSAVSSVSPLSPPPAAPQFHPDDLLTEGDVTAVPKEVVELPEISVQPPSEEVVEEQPPAETPAPVVSEILEDSAEPEQPVLPASEDAAAEATPAEDLAPLTVTPPTEDTVTDADDSAEPPAADGEKSPLDILEEILAGAEAEKNKKDDVEAQKKAEEERVQAEFAAKEQASQEQFAQRIEETRGSLGDLSEDRKAVEEELIQQGKIIPKNQGDPDDAFAIRQLKHDMTK